MLTTCEQCKSSVPATIKRDGKAAPAPHRIRGGDFCHGSYFGTLVPLMPSRIETRDPALNGKGKQ